MKVSTCPFALDPAGQDIPAEGDYLRAQGGVSRVELCGVPAWAVTSHSILREMLSDKRVSRDPRSHWAAWSEIPEHWPLYNWLVAPNMFTSHGAEHRRLRGVVSKTLTTKRVNELRPRIEEITRQRLDALAAREDEVVDLSLEFSTELPIRVFCALMGIDDEDMRERMCRAVFGLFDTTASPEQVVATRNDVERIIDDVIAEKRRNPGDDLTSALILANATEGDARLSDKELVGTIHVLMMGGYETTANLLGNAIYSLLSLPEQRELLRTGAVSWDDVIEETMRFQPSVGYLPLHFAVEDIELPNGITIPKGEAIISGILAASRDPEFYGPDADRFDARRANKKNFEFGHGVHFCVGAPLATAEAEISLPALFDRFPQLRFAEPPETLKPIESFIINGFQKLPVRLR